MPLASENEPPAPTPREPRPPVALQSRTLPALLVLAVLFTLHVARDFLLPVILSFILALVFRPVVRGLSRWKVPAALSAFVIVAGLAGSLGYGTAALYQPAVTWARTAPDALEQVKWKFRTWLRSMAKAEQAAATLDKLAKGETSDVPVVELRKTSISEHAFAATSQLASSALIVAFLLFFLLATGGRLTENIAAFLKARGRNAREITLVPEVEREVSAYLGTIAAINGCLGVAAGFAFWLLGLPNPVLWGVVVAAFNFVPYVGSAVGSVLVALAAVVTFDEPWRILAAPGIYLALSGFEGMLVTPLILGRRFAIDPCFVFLWLVFWSWLWGIAGAILAMPMLSALNIVSRRVESLHALSHLISAAPSPGPASARGSKA